MSNVHIVPSQSQPLVPDSGPGCSRSANVLVAVVVTVYVAGPSFRPICRLCTCTPSAYEISETPSPHAPGCWYVTTTLETTDVGVTLQMTVGAQYPYDADPQPPGAFGCEFPADPMKQYSGAFMSQT